MEVALFPLSNIIHLPGTNRPLNIFEPRYVAMVEKALISEMPIALCQGLSTTGHDSDADFMSITHENYKGVKRVCGAGIPILLKRFDDGALLIILTGEYTIKLEYVIDSEAPYLMAQAQIRQENRALDSHYSFMYQRMRSLLLQKLDRLVPHPTERERIRSELHSATRLIAYYCELMVPRAGVKEKVLMMTDINEKIDYLARLTLTQKGAREIDSL